MTTFVQLHMLTVYPPGNPNRDDIGRPKTALFGGALRLRLSSQSLKRAWRTSEVFARSLAGHLALRTQRFGDTAEQHLLERGAPAETARDVARQVAGLFGKSKAATDRNPTHTEQLVFLSPREQALGLALAEKAVAGLAIDPKAGGALCRSDTAVDIAMFGRMLAGDPEFSREAAVQVAHAMTTHAAVVEDDYYTAVDDLKTAADDAGAGFIGEAGFGAGVFYHYVCIDRDLLIRNLSGRSALAGAALDALIEAAATVAPKGRQASFASRTRAAYLLVEKDSAAPRTLAGAFLKPVGAEGQDMLAASIQALEAWREAFALAYGDAPAHAVVNVPARVGTLADLQAFARE